MPKISVVIPLYNKEKYIERTLNSVLQQTFSDFEVIIVNDASKDKSLERVKNIQDKRIRIIEHPKNKGLSAARNTGIHSALSEIITFIDADDKWKPFFLSEILQLSESFVDCAIYGTDYEIEIDQKRYQTKKNLPTHISSNDQVKIADFFEANTHHPIYNYSSVAFKKNVFDKIGGFDTSLDLGEDLDFNIRVNSNFSLAYCNKACVIYHADIPEQMTNSTIAQKRIIDFKKFDRQAEKNTSLKKYLNSLRYYYASQFKNYGQQNLFKKFSKEIDFSELSYKQKVMIKSPLWLYRILKKVKSSLIKKGVHVHPY
ncbi:glycosyltransferase family 2 protein [Mesonia sp. K7]|uniref:glycosyltransferase family 2 protein n=1 Tax=Mesonia sp. K7 TaxID=2218606 RepID=UPI000DA97DFA|nr:glycosyltransferase family 2 protein [Mesonia sp. K7]PZD78052.1 hypothetical protein DNG35_06670 [Mesonia sp. K7]